MIHCLVPRDPRPVVGPRVRIAPASEPEPDSVSAKAASSWPWASGGTSRPTCSGVPWVSSGSVPALVWTATVTPTPGVGARELLEHEHVGEEVGAGAAVLLGHAHAHQPELAEMLEDLASGSVCSRSHAAGVRRDLLVGEAPREVADLALLVGQLVQAHRLRTATVRAPVPTSAAKATAAGGLQAPAELLEAHDLPALLAARRGAARRRG